MAQRDEGLRWATYDDAEDDEAAFPNTVPPHTFRPSAMSPSPPPPPPPRAAAAVELPEPVAAAAPRPPAAGATHDRETHLRKVYARLRPYQRELFRASALQDSVVYLQTGGGKTWVAAALIALHLATNRTSRIFFVVRTVALAEQQAELLRKLLMVPVACVVGSKKEFSSCAAFCATAEYRVAVLIDSIFFRWLSEQPRLVTDPLASLVMLDEVHHADGGFYKKICEQLHSLRDKEGAAAQLSVRERLSRVGRRTPDASNLAAQLESVVREEGARLYGEEEGQALVAQSPVLDLLLRRYPCDMMLPQLVGLTASPVVHFGNKEKELVTLFDITQCRLIGVVEETANLSQHRPNPAIAALSYLPLYEERVLQSLLQRMLTQTFRRVEALVPSDTARRRLDTLRTTSVASPGFEACCTQFETDVAMKETFKASLRIPPGSTLYVDVQRFLAELEASEEDSEGERGHSSGRRRRLARHTSFSTEKEAQMCADFVMHALRFMRALSLTLIALQNRSYEAMLQTFMDLFSAEHLARIAHDCLPITALVLRPMLNATVRLLKAVRIQHAADSVHRAPVEPAAGQVGAAHVPVTKAEAIEAGRRALPRGLLQHSTRIQVLARLFLELAIVAVTMRDGPGDAANRHLRVLVFVETREQASMLMGILSDYCPLAYRVLRPEVLLGQRNKRASTDNYMTRAQQTALIRRFRSGEVQLVFATTVAEEGIDVPACHVVIRCQHQTELRSLVQCCGRLRMKNTLFISLCDLLNGHPRLGYVMDGIHASEAVLDNTASRCRDGAWSLDKDKLLCGTAKPGDDWEWGSSSGENDGGAYYPVAMASNPNDAVAFTPHEETLLARQRDILQALQRTFEAEVYCLHGRDAPGSTESSVSVTLMMSVPVQEHGSRGGRMAGEPWTTTPFSVPGAALSASSAVQWLCVSATVPGGAAKASKRAFVDFCADAKRKGLLDDAGHTVAAKARSCAAVRPSSELAALNVRCGYGQTLTPSLIFLGSGLYLCTTRTWPPSVLQTLFSESAAIMTTYQHDLWTSRIEPQTLLREELRSFKAPAPQFHVVAAAAAGRSGAASTASGGRQGVSGDSGSSRHSHTHSTSVSRTNSQDSRDWYASATRRGGGRGDAAAIGDEFAEVKFMVTSAAAAAGRAAVWPYVTQPPTYGNSSTSGSNDWDDVATAERCVVTERGVELTSTDKMGKQKVTLMREFCIRYRGPYAHKVVALEGLRLLGGLVVYGVEQSAVTDRLSRCRSVAILPKNTALSL